MENNEIKVLIDTFKEYRDLIGPIEQSLKAFSLSFDSISEDLKNLNSGFDGNIQGKLDLIYKELSGQADKARTLTQEVDRFLSSTNRYVSGVDSLIKICEKIESKLSSLNSIEEKAEGQIEKLSNIIEEKKKTYDIKQLERKLEMYNVGVQKVSDYINKDVADALKNSSDTINQIRDKNNSIFEAITSEKGSIDKLAESYDNSSKLLKKIVENNDVNEEYIFEILDKWAESRKVKTKK
ncbi:MAG: hypothetical protein E7354_05565 [Clostridiales bacterium]|nr:hypothetical protein [Clostridiales bacterium]